MFDVLASLEIQFSKCKGQMKVIISQKRLPKKSCLLFPPIGCFRAPFKTFSAGELRFLQLRPPGKPGISALCALVGFFGVSFFRVGGWGGLFTFAV